MQKSNLFPNRKLNRSTQTITETNFEVTLKFVILNRHPFPTSIKYRTFPSPSQVTDLHFTSTYQPRNNPHGGSTTFGAPNLV